MADLVCGEVVVEAYPILNIYPARRMFHQPLEITLPVRDAKAAKERWKNCHPRSDTRSMIYKQQLISNTL